MSTHVLEARIGSERNAKGSLGTFERRNPANQSDVVAIAPANGRQEVDAACAAARAALGKWSATPAPIRGQTIARLAGLLREKKEELSRLVTREVGKPLREARGSVQ